MYPDGNISCLCVREDILLPLSFFSLLFLFDFHLRRVKILRGTGEIFTSESLLYIIKKFQLSGRVFLTHCEHAHTFRLDNQNDLFEPN
jgi:hypothetical protein